MMRPIELDHVFLFVPDERCATQMLAAAGLTVNYSRIHQGQGTRNLCACLDDMFIELLWLDGSPIAPECERLRLAACGRGQGSPIGVSWRGPYEIACFEYAAPFLPTGMTIPVANASLDPELPLIFRSPGGTRPIDRTDGLVGNRQSPSLTVLGHCEVAVPNPKPVAFVLEHFDRVSVRQGSPSLHLTLLDAQGRVGREVRLSGGQGA
jgi:hypothetical protein